MNDRPPLPELHELEAELMREAWDLQEATARQVHASLNARSSKQRAYTTVLSVLSRLHRKGLLERQRVGKADVYRPALDEGSYQRTRAAEQVGALVDEYGDAALAHFVREVDALDASRLARLRELAQAPDDAM